MKTTTSPLGHHYVVSTRPLGQQWCRYTQQYRPSWVTIDSSAGGLVLCDVMQILSGPEMGSIKF